MFSCLVLPVCLIISFFTLSLSLALSHSTAFFLSLILLFLFLPLFLRNSHSLALSFSLAHFPSFVSPLALVFGRLVPSLSQEIYPFVSLQVRKTTELVFGGKRKKQHWKKQILLTVKKIESCCNWPSVWLGFACLRSWIIVVVIVTNYNIIKRFGWDWNCLFSVWI